jgi:deoxyribonuclease-1
MNLSIIIAEVAADDRFEPEHGKGACVRAMLYFLLRYPKAIKKTFRTEIDIPLLVRWHQEFPVTLYENHRNQAIYQIQGNRNPLVDFPDSGKKIPFPIYFTH